MAKLPDAFHITHAEIDVQASGCVCRPSAQNAGLVPVIMFRGLACFYLFCGFIHIVISNE